MTGQLLEQDDLDRLATRAIRRQYRSGGTLFYEGDPSDRVVLLVEGRVKVVTVTADGREVLLAVRGPGDVLGELSALDGGLRSATAIALEPVEALLVDSDEFVAYLELTPRIAVRLLRVLVSRQRDSDRKRVEFSAYDVVGRVARRLVELVEQHGERTGDGPGAGVRITLPLTQDDLAGYTGSSREAVSKALQTMRRDGVLTTQRRAMVVLDVDELRRRAH